MYPITNVMSAALATHDLIVVVVFFFKFSFMHRSPREWDNMDGARGREVFILFLQFLQIRFDHCAACISFLQLRASSALTVVH